MSDAGPTSSPATCSGDMKAGVPKTTPVPVRPGASAAREIPKSISRGRSASSTLDGFTSRCTTSAACTTASARASPPASRCAVVAGSGPAPATA